MREIERVILEKAIAAFERRTKLGITVLRHNLPGNLDALIQILAQGKEYEYAANVKINLTPANLGVTIRQLNEERIDGKTITIARYVTPKLAETLLGMGIDFIDTAGNALINDPPLYIFIKGTKVEGEAPAEPRYRAFRAAGLQGDLPFIGESWPGQCSAQRHCHSCKCCTGNSCWRYE